MAPEGLKAEVEVGVDMVRLEARRAAAESRAFVDVDADAERERSCLD